LPLKRIFTEARIIGLLAFVVFDVGQENKDNTSQNQLNI
jgi:hypothetical protein